MSSAIDVCDMTKRFGAVRALAGISFQVEKGELFGFLGPNGAGKTTTINILTGLARADGGTVRVAGHDCAKNPKAAQHLIGVVPDESNLYPELSGLDNLCFCAALYGVEKEEARKRAHRLLADMELTQAGNRKFGGYSKGMKRKLTIAAGIIHQPAILFLDEPTTGIDVASARWLRALIEELHEQGTTIFLTTHYIEEAERLCDRIAFVVGGRIVRSDTVENLLQPVRDKHVLQISCAPLPPTLLSALTSRFSDFAWSMDGAHQLRSEADHPISVAPLVRFLEEQGIEVSEARRLRPSLEDVFVRVTGLAAAAMRGEKEKGGKKP